MTEPNSPPENDAPEAGEAAEGEALPPYIIEAARSSRSKCRTCRRKIDKGNLRIGVLVEGGFYGPGHVWHHLTCAARRHPEQVEEAYELEAWTNAKEVPANLPSLAELQELREKAEEKRRNRKQVPYVEVDPSGRARCKQCGELIEKGSLRVALGREVVFGQQTRTAVINVHPGCVRAALEAEDAAPLETSLEEALRENSVDLEPEQIDAALAAIGPEEG